MMTCNRDENKVRKISIIILTSFYTYIIWILIRILISCESINRHVILYYVPPVLCNTPEPDLIN